MCVCVYNGLQPTHRKLLDRSSTKKVASKAFSGIEKANKMGEKAVHDFQVFAQKLTQLLFKAELWGTPDRSPRFRPGFREFLIKFAAKSWSQLSIDLVVKRNKSTMDHAGANIADVLRVNTAAVYSVDVPTVPPPAGVEFIDEVRAKYLVRLDRSLAIKERAYEEEGIVAAEMINVLGNLLSRGQLLAQTLDRIELKAQEAQDESDELESDLVRERLESSRLQLVGNLGKVEQSLVYAMRVFL